MFALKFFTVLNILFTFRIFEQLALALKHRVVLKIFTVLKYFLLFRNFEQLALVLKTELPWNFSLYWNIFYHSGIFSNLRLPWKHRLPATHLVRLWAYGIEDENTIFCNAWKMTISKRRKYALCPLNGFSLFGSKIRGYYYYKKGTYVQVIITTARRYFRGRQYGPAWKCIYPKNKPTKNARNRGNVTKRTSELHERAINSKKRSQCNLFFRRM